MITVEQLAAMSPKSSPVTDSTGRVFSFDFYGTADEIEPIRRAIDDDGDYAYSLNRPDNSRDFFRGWASVGTVRIYKSANEYVDLPDFH